MTNMSVDGLVSGLSTSDLISQLMQIEKQPQVAMQNKVASLNTRISALQSLNSKWAAIGDAAKAISTAAKWSMWKATSSQPTIAGVTTSDAAVGGSLTFTVNQLATAGAVIGSGTFSSLTANVASGPILVGKGGAAYGVSTVLGSGLTAGNHSITVTQASAGATVTGTALAASTTIANGSNTLNVNVDGVAQSYTIASGTYTQSQLAAAVQTASGGALAASVDNSGRLVLSTTKEGSAHSLQITGGNALGSLGLAAGSAVTGTDGILKADNGATVTMTDVQAGASATLTSDLGGTMTVKLGSNGLNVGTFTMNNVAVGDGSLGSVVGAINTSGTGVTASAVQVSPGNYKLQLSSNATGASNGVNIDAAAFTGVGSLTTLVAATDAQITVGSGAGAYTVSSSTNAVSTLLPGVTINLLKADPATPVNVTLNADGDGLADKVQKLVDAANAAVGEIQDDTAYDATAKKAGILIGDPVVSNMQRRIAQAVTDAVSGGAFSSSAQVGINLNKDGTFTFDRAKFLSAYASDPTSVQKMFVQSLSATDPKISVISGPINGTATDTSWAVNITAVATQAGMTTTLGSGKFNPSETLSYRMNGTTVSYTTANNETVASVATNLNNQFKSGGLGLVASVVSNQLVVNTTGYGSAATFDVMSSRTNSGYPTTWTTKTGTDVAGTVNGVTFTGTGQTLTAPGTDPTLAGLVINSANTTTGAKGSITYGAGIAQRLVSRSKDVTDSVTGQLTLAVQGVQSQVTDLTKQISAYDVRLSLRETLLKKQFADLEVNLGKYKDQGNWLAGQISSLG